MAASRSTWNLFPRHGRSPWRFRLRQLYFHLSNLLTQPRQFSPAKGCGILRSWFRVAAYRKKSRRPGRSECSKTSIRSPQAVPRAPLTIIFRWLAFRYIREPDGGGSARHHLAGSNCFGTRIGTELFLAGLGAISDFLPKAVETAGESLARMLVATHVFEFATVPIGANSGISLKGAIESFLTGFLRGLHATDGARGFRRITLCELKPDRYLELKYRVEALNASGAFKAQGFEVIATTQTQGAKAAAGELKSQGVPPSKTAFLGRTYYVEVTNKAHDIFEYALLGMPGAAAPCFTATAAISDGIKCVLDAPSCPRFDAALGAALADAYMPENLRAELSHQLTEEPGRLVIIHDAASAAVPWEASFIDGRSLALDMGVRGQYKPTARSAPAKEIPRKRPEGARGCGCFLYTTQPAILVARRQKRWP